MEQIKHKLFALQVINVNYISDEYFNFEEKKQAGYLISMNYELERGQFGFGLQPHNWEGYKDLPCNPYTQAQLELSDGIGYATAVVQKDVLDELWAFDNRFQ